MEKIPNLRDTKLQIHNSVKWLIASDCKRSVAVVADNGYYVQGAITFSRRATETFEHDKHEKETKARGGQTFSTHCMYEYS